MANGNAALEVQKQELLGAIDDIKQEGHNVANTCPAPAFARAMARGHIALLRSKVADCEQLQSSGRDVRSIAVTVVTKLVELAVVATVAMVAARIAFK